MELLATWRTLYTLRYCPVTLVQTAFSAGTVYLLIAMQASSGTRIARKELRHSLDQETLVQQYLQDIGLSWNCATSISVTLRSLMNEQVRPLLELLDRKSIPTAGLHVAADIGDDEGENDSSLFRSISRRRSFRTKLKSQISQPHTMPSGSGQSSLSTPPNHILTFPTQVPPSAELSISPTFTISLAHDTSSTHAPSAPIAIPSQPLRSSSSSNPSSFTDSWALPTSPGSSPDFNYLQQFLAHSDLRKHAQSSNFMDSPFFGYGNSSGDDAVGSLAHNIQPLSGPSSEVDGYLGMLGGQTLSEVPFVKIFSNIEDTHSLNSTNFLHGAPLGTGFPSHESSSPSSSSSLGGYVPSSSYVDTDNMDLGDSVPWRLI